jgi:hypothetical protein
MMTGDSVRIRNLPQLQPFGHISVETHFMDRAMTPGRLLFPTSLCLALSVLPALANDGWGGISSTGLTFGETDAVVMEAEDLYISINRIEVDYVFRNVTDKDVTGEVIFPLPPLSLEYILDADWNLPDDPDRTNLLNFKAVVDGQEVPVTIDRIAVIAPQWQEGQPPSLVYESPGRDVTADLERLGIPLSLNREKLLAALQGLDAAARAEATKLGLADFDDDGASPGRVYPYWSIVLRYHWTQTFPAGKVVKISHEYENRSPGSLFGWSDPPESYAQSDVSRYCIDAGTSKALAKAMRYVAEDGQVYSGGYAHNIEYVLRTANSWAGPIGKFRLTIDKEKPENVVSLCADGIRKTGPTTFVMEKTDYVPDRDLQILIASPVQD